MLSELGHEQCRRLDERLVTKEPLAGRIEVVVCSPLRRCVQTMVEGLKGVLGEVDGTVRVEFEALWQGEFCEFFVASQAFIALMFVVP